MSSTKPAAKPRSCQVLVIGDSLGQGLASGFMQQLHGVKGTRIINKAKASTGLSNWWFYDWSTQLPPMLKKYKPHLVVVMLGGNDHQNMSVNKDVVKFGSDDWVRIYSSRIQKIISLANASGAYVAWVGLPIAAPVKYSRAMRKLNSYYSEVASRNPQAVYIPTWDYFATASGAYRETARVGNQVVDLRSDDGIHFSIAGYGVLGTYVLKQLSTSFHVRLGGKHPKTISG